MAVEWPTSLPAPLRSGLVIKPSPGARGRLLQSGRKEVRRWGTGGGDTVTFTLRLFKNHPAYGDQVAAFERFYDRDLSFGRNWINAWWLSLLGYTGCYCRVTGYTQVSTVGSIHCDYAVTVSIRGISDAWADAMWPSRVELVPSDALDGTVVVGNLTTTAAIVTGLPVGLRAVKVEPVWGQLVSTYYGRYLAAAALTLGGTIVAWGDSLALANVAGFNSLSGIKDIAGCLGGLYFITQAGTIGHLGSPSPGTSYPAGDGYVRIWSSHRYHAFAQRADGLLVSWNSNASFGIPAGVYNPKHVQLNRTLGNGGHFHRGMIVDVNGNAYACGDTTGLLATNVRCGFYKGPGSFYTDWYTEAGAWGFTGTHTFYPRPDGVVPVLMTASTGLSSVSYGLYGAIAQDGLLHFWNDSTIASKVFTKPSGLFVKWVTAGSYLTGTATSTENYFFFAIKKD